MSFDFSNMWEPQGVKPQLNNAAPIFGPAHKPFEVSWVGSEAKAGASQVPWYDRFPSWTYLLVLAGLLAAAFLLSWLFPQIFWSPPDPPLGVLDARCPDGGHHLTGYGFFYNYYWGPILCDEGYNVYNTASWAVLLGLILLWLYRLSLEIKENVGLSFVLAGVPYLVWGSIFRVLEDADLFAPYGTLQPPVPTGHGFLDHYLGVFFVTPIIYVEITFLVIGLLLWGHRARRVAEGRTVSHGLQYFAYSLLLLLALYTALWASHPTYLRRVAHPLVALGGCLVAFWLVYRHARNQQRIDPHVVMGAYGLVFLTLGLYYMSVWMTGGFPTWHPPAPDPAALTYPLRGDLGTLTLPVQGWVLGALVLAPALLVVSARRKGLLLAGVRRETERPARSSYGLPVLVLVLFLLAEALAVFLSVLGLQDLAQRQIAHAWSAGGFLGYAKTVGLLAAGPAAIGAGTWVARAWARGPLGIHPVLAYFAAPINLLMLWGQATDAFMTSLGIDVYHYQEKHVLPRFLIEGVDSLHLPEPWGNYSTTMVMIPLKLLVVLLVVVAIDASADKELRTRANLINLVKLGIIMVGLSPGVRDAVRLAMVT